MVGDGGGRNTNLPSYAQIYGLGVVAYQTLRRRSFYVLSKIPLPMLIDSATENGISYAWKSMLICGLALNTNGCWEERQLKPELQTII